MKHFEAFLEAFLKRKCLVFPVVELELGSPPLETQRKICIFIRDEVQFPILREFSFSFLLKVELQI